MTLWDRVGYSKNPYSVEPLPPTEEGSSLLVGRDRELRRLLSQIRSTDTHPTIEGENGVGKTSLVFVAAYQAELEFRQGETGQLLLPVSRALQVKDDPAAFERIALLAIAQAYLDYADLLSNSGYEVPDLNGLRRWIEDPLLRAGGGGASVLGFGGNATVSVSANTSVGFAEAGLRSFLTDALGRTFPSLERGAFVAVIDNLELLQTSTEARRVLEYARDGILALPGVRWVLCGAKGIVRSAASSPRLAGRIGSPIELRPISDDLVPELVRRRLSTYSVRPDPDTPVSPEGFKHLYDVSNKNLRNALKYAQDFSVWLDAEDLLASPAADRNGYLEAWLAETADEYDASAELQAAQWSLFDKIADAGGSIAPGDYESFGFNTSQAMRFHLQRLEQANLVDSAIDETDQRRRTISITSVGWIVRYRRSGFQPGASVAPVLSPRLMQGDVPGDGQPANS